MSEGPADVSPARRHIIKRPRLTRLLDETNARILLLVAPAGYGKTTLAREWAEAPGRITAWYSTTPASVDVAALASGIAEASRPLVEGAGSRLGERTRAVSAPPADLRTVINLVAADLADWPSEAWLIVDDYHLVMDSQASEDFVDGLLALTPLKILVTSRKRPSWATARRILYGEIHEVGQTQLALTPEEARDVLVERSREEIAGLVALAEGWPAVIGLAALSREPLTWEEGLPHALYDYFAEELYKAVGPGLQDALCQMAAAPTLSWPVLSSLFEDDTGAIAAGANDIGFVSTVRRDTYDIHPLLRSFLEEKLRERGEHYIHSLVERLGSALIRLERWDDAGLLADRFDADWLVEQLVRGSLDELLASGRLETLDRWSRQGARDSAVLALARSEIAYRKGEYSKAETLALQAASALGSEDDYTSRAWFRAGQAAQFIDAGAARGSEYFDRALATKRSALDQRNALWGLFNSSVEQGDENAVEFLEQYRDSGPVGTAEEVRIASGLLFHACIFGDTKRILDRARGLRTLARDCNDPMIRSNFFNMLAHNLVLAAEYEEALDVVREELIDARQFQLTFAIPYALLVRAKAELGLRRFAHAHRSIQQALDARITHEDQHVAANAATTLARISIARGRAEEACTITARTWTQLPGGMLSEFLATRALALACTGQTESAVHLCAEALRAGRTVEGRMLTLSIRAAVASRSKEEHAPELVREAFHSAISLGDIDSFVLVCRGLPELAIAAAECSPERRSELATILSRAQDRDLARRAGLLDASFPGDSASLSKRESEVLGLLVEGLSNREIAERLFISEMTAKVHVRHILRKLGVRSRTEAAVRGAVGLTD